MQVLRGALRHVLFRVNLPHFVHQSVWETVRHSICTADNFFVYYCPGRSYVPEYVLSNARLSDSLAMRAVKSFYLYFEHQLREKENAAGTKSFWPIETTSDKCT